MNLNVFERVFRIIDCDDFTRKFYEYMGVQLNEPEQIPEDNFEQYTIKKEIKIPPPDLAEYKEYNEVKLRGGHPNGGLQKYLENDRKVLSFKIYWYDNSLEGGINYYTMNFFLADDTIEIKESAKPNSGKDPFPLLLNRRKMPKKPIMSHYPGMSQKKEEYYTAADLGIGKEIVLYNKVCFIYGCDEFTKHWYKENMGIDQVDMQLSLDKAKKFYQPVPPYNGFGSEEDSLGSVKSLQPKPPRKDINKMYT